MPASRDLAYLVNATREELQIFGDAVAYRNGYGVEADTTLTSITRRINECLGELCIETEFSVADFTQALAENDNSYTLNVALINIISVQHNNKQLRPTSREALDERDGDWYGAAASATLTHYFREGSSIFVYPKPSAAAVAAGNLIITATNIVADLAISTDAPTVLPVVFHDFLIYGAALKLAHIDADNEVHTRRVAFLQSEWERGKKALRAYTKPADLDAPISLDEYRRQATFSRTAHDPLQEAVQ